MHSHHSLLLIRFTLNSAPTEAATGGVLQKNVFLEISQKTWHFIRNETLAQVFSCEFCEISNNKFSTEPAAQHLQATASAPSSSLSLLLLLISPIFVFRSNSKG